MGNSPLKSDAIERSMPVKRSLEFANDNPPTDSKKPKIIDEQRLQLIDINDHCLWHTFEFLNADDLVNMAEAHERFIPVAISVFRRLFRKMKKLVVPYQLEPIDSCLCPTKENIEPLFRHFGHLISNALINFLGDKRADIQTLLQEYSADSLVELSLTYFDENDFQNIIKPFSKLEKLQIVESAMNQNVSQFNVWFPNVQHLELVYVKLSQPELFEINFPHLKHLEIYNCELEVPIKTIAEMLRKNPQLKSFTLLSDYDRALIESLSQSVPALEVLELWAPPDRFSSFQDEKIHFASVKKFTLNACSSRGDFLVNVPFTFGTLEELTFDGFNQFKGQILDFVMQCTTVKSLKLVPYIDDWDDLMLKDLRNIFDALPQLTELEFCADTFAIDDIIRMLNESKHLNSVNLVFMEMPWCEHFEEKIEKKWDLTKLIVEKYSSCEHLSHAQYCLKRKIAK